MFTKYRNTALAFLAACLSLTAQAQKDDHAHDRSCGTMQVYEQQNKKDPEVAARRQAIERDIQRYIAQDPKALRTTSVVTIPVVVHVLYNNSTQNISDAQVQSQIDVLNADFAKLNSDASLVPSLFSSVAANTNIQFCLAKRTPTGLSTNGITRTFTSESSFADDDGMKSSATGGIAPWDATKYLNIWVCNLGGGLLGYAQFPGGSVATDGVVINYTCFGTSGTAVAPFNKGRTGTHEVGHWLNLRHIWGDANCGTDFVNDTPTQEDKNFGCPSFPQPTCSNTSDMWMNYMDYTDDACMYMFTAGQGTRMNAAITASRAGLLTSDGCTPSTNYCQGLTTLAASNGTVTDNSGTSNYNNNTNCQWLIQPFGATSISITFTAFATEAGNDLVQVYNGTSSAGTLVGTYSGSTIPAVINITGSAAYVVFTSNASTTAAGWSFNYTSVVPAVGCSGLSTYTAASGTITDGSGPLSYTDDANCSFYINPPAGLPHLYIDFTEFSTESSFDEVKIYNGTSASAQLVADYSGSNLPAGVYLNSGKAFITFITDNSVTSSGWSLTYNAYATAQTTCAGLSTFTASSGAVTDGSGASNYGSNANCQFLIQPSATTTAININFTLFRTEVNYDFVKVYAGTSATGTLLGTYDGTTVPAALTVNGPAAFVTFTSDGSVNLAGWSFNYTATVPTSVATTYLLDGEVEVFPNPADNLVTIRVNLNSGAAVNCKLLNAYGQPVWEKNFNQTEIEASANIENLPAGMYYVQVTDERGRSKVEKLVRR